MRHIYIILLLSITYVAQSQCIADFTVMTSGNQYQFSSVSQVAEGDTIATTQWTFGDGSSSNLPSPLHNYTLPGMYDVILDIETTSGCVSSDTMQIEVCQLGLDFNLSTVCTSNSLVAIVLDITDQFEAIDSVEISLDGIAIHNPIRAIESQLSVEFMIAGDGNQHTITVKSLPNGFCSETINFFVQDCNASCFLSDLSIDEGFQETHNIALFEDQFMPANREIQLGDRVRFIWLSDNHTSTSIDSVSIDQWDSGVQDSSYILEITPRNPGIKPFYSATDGGPQGTYFGNLLANCPSNQGSIIGIQFFNELVPEEGFYIGVDGVTLKDTIYDYSPLGVTNVEFLLVGDGNTHQISIVDVQDDACSIASTTRAINCAGDFACSLNIKGSITERCNEDSLVTIGFDINSLKPTNAGVLVMSADSVVMDTFYFDGDRASGSLQLKGDGSIRQFLAIDLSDTLCTDIISILLNDCDAPCSIENLEVGTGSNNTIVLNLEDNQIRPQTIQMSTGDKILWQWQQDSLVGIRSIVESGPNSWDSGIRANGAIFTSPVLSAGFHPYYIYNQFGDTIYNANLEVIAACEDNLIPIVYNFSDINGATGGYDIYVDDVRLPNGPFGYNLEGNNRGIFQLEGDDETHNIEIRDSEDEACSATTNFLAPSCIKPPCGASVMVQMLDTCYNNNTVDFIASTFHPNPSPQGFVLRLNGTLFGNGTYLYGTNGINTFSGRVLADSSVYQFTLMDILDTDCVDTVNLQTPLCVTDCSLFNPIASVIDSAYQVANPSIPDSIVGCQDSMIYVEVLFNEQYSDADSFFVSVDGEVYPELFPYENGDQRNSFRLLVMGDDETHAIRIHDALNAACFVDVDVYTPRCFSECNIEVDHIVLDSCIHEVGTYTVHLATENNRTNFLIFVDDQFANSSIDSTGFSIDIAGDGLSHSILLVDQQEPLCRDSIEFLADYCLSCPLDLSIIQRDSCEVEDSIGYTLRFGQGVDSLMVQVKYNTLEFNYWPTANNNGYDFRLQGDSSVTTFYVTSLEDQFCADTITIQTIDCTPIICEPAFSYEIDGLTITFTDSSTTSEPIVSQEWTINQVFSINDLATFNFTVDSIGLYDVCHTITTDSCSSMICQEVLVGDPCDLVIPSFTIEGEEGSFQFTNTSQGQIDDIRYDFGDGIFSNNPHPFHIYQETGDFTVCIQVTQDEYNCIKEFCDTIQVTISSSTDIDRQEAVLYPNPIPVGSTRINLNYKGAPLQMGHIKMYDVNGSTIPLKDIEILHPDAYRITFQGQMAQGVYYMVLRQDKGLLVRKLIVQ